MPENEPVAESQAQPQGAPAAGAASPAAPPDKPFDQKAFLLDYSKREKALKDAHSAEIKKHQSENRRLSQLASLKELPDEDRDALMERGSFNAESAEFVRDRFNLPDELMDDIVSKGSYPKMLAYGERMSKILGTAKPATPPSNVTDIPAPAPETAATERVMAVAGSRVVQQEVNKDNIDKLHLEGKISDERYRKFLSTGEL